MLLYDINTYKSITNLIVMAKTNKQKEVESIEKILCFAMTQRSELGSFGGNPRIDEKINGLNDGIISLQTRYQELTGRFYTLAQ